MDDFLLKCWGLSGAEVRKSYRSRQEFSNPNSNEYFLAKIGVDSAENEPLEVSGKIFNIIHRCPYSGEDAPSAEHGMERAVFATECQKIMCPAFFFRVDASKKSVSVYMRLLLHAITTIVILSVKHKSIQFTHKPLTCCNINTNMILS